MMDLKNFKKEEVIKKGRRFNQAFRGEAEARGKMKLLQK
jgi:hypothetical protein